MGSGDLDHHTPTTEDILNEAQRRLQESEAQRRLQKKAAQQPPSRQTWADKLNRGVFWLARHWLAVFNAFTAIFLGGAMLPPVFLRLGLAEIAEVLYAVYRPLCHQYPFRSWFLFGPQLAYPLTQPISVREMETLRHFIGDPHVGYKMAICQRDIAIYGAMLLAGLVFGMLRRRQSLQPWPMWRYFAFGIAPMMLDGGVQWISHAAWLYFPLLVKAPFETTPLMRALTGALFGLGIVAAAYPHLNAYFEDVRHALEQKYSATIS
jgi:uncharacterized membrane protein